MFGDYTTHDRFVGIKAACKYLSKKKKGNLKYFGEGKYAFSLSKDGFVFFTAFNWLHYDFVEEDLV
jgi:hypothetical protein